jgi:hypothetical protein
MFDSWEAAECPSQERCATVLNWLAARADNPYLGMRRVPEIPGLWFGQIPGTRDADGAVVCCSYFILDEDRLVRCDMLASLKPPFG